jgi:hypothetical protein
LRIPVPESIPSIIKLGISIPGWPARIHSIKQNGGHEASVSDS